MKKFRIFALSMFLLILLLWVRVNHAPASDNYRRVREAFDISPEVQLSENVVLGAAMRRFPLGISESSVRKILTQADPENDIDKYYDPPDPSNPYLTHKGVIQMEYDSAFLSLVSNTYYVILDFDEEFKLKQVVAKHEFMAP